METLEADVSKLEAELAAVRAELGADHAGDWQKLHALADRESELDALLARRMAEWEAARATALSERRAPLNQSSTSPDSMKGHIPSVSTLDSALRRRLSDPTLIV